MKSFVWAFRGVGYAVATQRNMRVHLCAALYVVAFGLITGISQAQWTAVLSCIGLVTALECLNTALEALCDTLHPGRDAGIAHAKDAAAGAVLLAAVASAAVGAVVFFRRDRIDAVLALFAAKPWTVPALAASLVLAALFIRGKNTKTPGF